LEEKLRTRKVNMGGGGFSFKKWCFEHVEQTTTFGLWGGLFSVLTIVLGWSGFDLTFLKLRKNRRL